MKRKPKIFLDLTLDSSDDDVQKKAKTFMSLVEEDTQKAAITLLLLPSDIRLRLMMFLDPNSIFALCRVNKEFKKWCDDKKNVIWNMMIKKYYHGKSIDQYKKHIGVNEINSRLLFVTLSIIRTLKSTTTVSMSQICTSWNTHPMYFDLMLTKNKFGVSYGEDGIWKPRRYPDTSKCRLDMFLSKYFDKKYPHHDYWLGYDYSDDDSDAIYGWSIEIADMESFDQKITQYIYMMLLMHNWKTSGKLKFKPKIDEIMCHICTEPAKFVDKLTDQLFCSKQCFENWEVKRKYG